MELTLDKQDHLKVYCPYGGGITLELTGTKDGLEIFSINARLKVRQKQIAYGTKWLLYREDEGGYDRT